MARAVFLGSDSFSVPILEALLLAGPDLTPAVEVCGVVTQPDRPAGRGRRVSANPVKELARGCALPVLQPERVRDPAAIEAVLALRPDLLVLASFGQLLPGPLLETPPHKCLNLHPSLLPLHRGPSPIVGTILSGDTVTGATLMLMSRRMDAGPILAQERTRVREEETAGELEERLALLSAALLLKVLPGWLRGTVDPRPQDETRASYTSRVVKEDARVDWHLPAQTLARRVQAYNPWPVAFTFWDNRQLRLLRASHVEGEGEPGQVQGLREGALAVGTGGGVLLVRELQLAGGRPMEAAVLVRGHSGLLAARLCSGGSWL